MLTSILLFLMSTIFLFRTVKVLKFTPIKILGVLIWAQVDLLIHQAIFWKSPLYPFIISSVFPFLLLFTWYSFYFSFIVILVRDVLWEFVIRSCVLFDRGTLFMEVYQQVVVALIINSEGKLLISFFSRNNYGLIIRKLYKTYELVIHKKHRNWQSVRSIQIVNL